MINPLITERVSGWIYILIGISPGIQLLKLIVICWLFSYSEERILGHNSWCSGWTRGGRKNTEDILWSPFKNIIQISLHYHYYYSWVNDNIIIYWKNYDKWFLALEELGRVGHEILDVLRPPHHPRSLRYYISWT